ncbi:MAG: type II toxin-antitoxin system HicA family toxin [Acidobacteria bacterium]|nr:MAG: type II toxin-antitoxin system HicA family toxin [Acidobacteriota bacterium]
MSRLRAVRPSEMVAFLESLGFRQARQRGSHRFFRHPDGRTATVPVHRGEDLGRGIVAKILHDARATQSDLAGWLG